MNNNEILDNFIEDLEDFYKKISIYRSIIITNNNIEKEYIYNNLLLKDFSIINIDIINNITNYENIDIRIIILTKDIYKDFIDIITKNKMKDYITSYNFIAFCNILHTNTLKNYYYDKTNNIKDDTILYYNNICNI